MKNISPNSSIGVAFLGVGRMGETHLRSLTGLSGVKVVVVEDPRPEAAERGKAIAHPSVDAVVIITPTDTPRAFARTGRSGRQGGL